MSENCIFFSHLTILISSALYNGWESFQFWRLRNFATLGNGKRVEITSFWRHKGIVSCFRSSKLHFRRDSSANAYLILRTCKPHIRIASFKVVIVKKNSIFHFIATASKISNNPLIFLYLSQTLSRMLDLILFFLLFAKFWCANLVCNLGGFKPTIP